MSTPPHPIEAIEAACAAYQRAVEAVRVGAQTLVVAAVLAEARRQLPGVGLTAESRRVGACVVVWWREGRPEAIAIETRLRPEEPRRTGRVWRWRWEAWPAKRDDVFGYGETIREALDHLAAQDPRLAPLVAELLAEVTPCANEALVDCHACGGGGLVQTAGPVEGVCLRCNGSGYLFDHDEVTP